MSSNMTVANAQDITFPPLGGEEEGSCRQFSLNVKPSSGILDAVIHTRITNDERPLRRVVKKFHHYTTVAHTPIVPSSSNGSTSVEDAREAFLVEVASFQLTMRKSMMICEAEARQVEEYERERTRIGESRVQQIRYSLITM